jgi:NAD(P)-dependent dehydrogenase (short-subunit alcohol dehydrogenase family)
VPGQNLRGFAEKVALVTGGSSRIGRAVALQLALEGAYVILQSEALSEGDNHFINELQSLGTLVSAVRGTVSTADGVIEVFSAVEPIFGRLDLLVNAAGNEGPGDNIGSDDERWDATVGTMSKGAYSCSLAAQKLMAGRPSPAIINVAVWDDVVDKQTRAVRLAASRALEGVTAGLAEQLQPRVRVNCVALNERAGGADPAQIVASDDAARVCVYLLSGEARAIRGQVIRLG